MSGAGGRIAALAGAALVCAGALGAVGSLSAPGSALGRGFVVSAGALGPSLRLRVIGASDETSDQAAKFAVRNAVLRAAAPVVARSDSAQAAAGAIRAHLWQIRAAADAAAARWRQPVRVALGVAPFPAERLGWLVFPAGAYRALVVTLGAGHGHNWWTVMFPQLADVRLGGHSALVGPAERGDPGGRWAVRSGTLDGVRVQVRFLLWELLRQAGRRWAGPLLLWARRGGVVAWVR